MHKSRGAHVDCQDALARGAKARETFEICEPISRFQDK